MKNKIKSLTVFFLVFVISFLSLSSTTTGILDTKLCAQAVDRGNSCVANKADCSGLPGYTLVADAKISYTGVTASQFLNSFNGTYGSNASGKLCISNSYKTVIRVYGRKGEAANGSNQQLQAFSTVDQLFIEDIEATARVCPNGWNASTAPNTINGWGNPIGCCPSGYKFVNPLLPAVNANPVSVLDTQTGACLKNTINGSSPTRVSFSYSGGNTEVTVYAGDNVIYKTPTFNIDQGQYADWQSLKNDIGTANVIHSYKSSLGFGVQPVLGQGLGSAFQDADIAGEDIPKRIATGSAYTGSDFTCPTNSQCAVDRDGNLTNIRKASDYLTTPGLTCGGCYTNGDTLGVSSASAGAVDDPATSVDESIGYVRFCDSTAPNGLYRDETLLGSADITRGYLLEDGANQALYKQCFDTGGIYTAIGCVDPTPTGIITGLIRIALGVMGGVALLQMIYVGILYQQGDTEKIKGARSQLIATITGIAVLIFSVLILRVIGVNILDTVANGSV